MNVCGLEAIAREWRADVEVLRRWGALAQADVLATCADLVDDGLRAWLDEELCIAEAAVESGYSEDHLRDLVRSGRIPDLRAPGSEGRIVVRRRDLPRRPEPAPASTDFAVIDEMVESLR